MNDTLLSKYRLAIVTELMAAEWVSFSELQRLLEISNGNLATHLAKLVSENYVAENKRFIGRRPNTRYRLTDFGRDKFLEHVAWINAVVEKHNLKNA